MVEEEERWEFSSHLHSDLLLNWGAIEPNSSVICMVLKATANDRRHLALCLDEFRGPRSGLCRSEAWTVVGRLEGGQTQAEVAQAIGVSQSVISRIWNRFLETGSAGREPGQGR
ncbi:uncharacterized protein TNCV_2138711 [Trichonephila clavipes]|nr:uncharacterized protein TNCV_2138711 [Trichonephila clavipes]